MPKNDEKNPTYDKDNAVLPDREDGLTPCTPNGNKAELPNIRSPVSGHESSTTISGPATSATRMSAPPALSILHND